MSLETGVKLFHYSLIISDINKDSIFGVDFLQYYVCELQQAGVLYIHDPYNLSGQCELHHDS